MLFIDGSAKEFNYHLGIPGLGVPSKSGWVSNILWPGKRRSAGDRGRRPEQARAPPAPAFSCPDLLPGFMCPQMPGLPSWVFAPR